MRSTFGADYDLLFIYIYTHTIIYYYILYIVNMLDILTFISILNVLNLMKRAVSDDYTYFHVVQQWRDLFMRLKPGILVLKVYENAWSNEIDIHWIPNFTDKSYCNHVYFRFMKWFKNVRGIYRKLNCKYLIMKKKFPQFMSIFYKLHGLYWLGHCAMNKLNHEQNCDLCKLQFSSILDFLHRLIPIKVWSVNPISN